MNTQTLARLISRKLDALSQLYELGRRQRELIDGGELDSLIRVLSAKQRLLTFVQTIEADLKPFQMQDPEQRQWPTVEQRDSCRRNAQRCQTLLAEIVRLEKECETLLICRREQAAVRLQQVHSAAEARGAYRLASGPKSTGLDLLSES